MQIKKAYSLVSTFALSGLLFHGASVVAQQTQNRISGEIASGSPVILRGSANLHAAAPNDVGHVDPSTRLTGVTIHFKLTLEQKQELDALVAAQQTAGSAYYHNWITPEVYASRFGLNNHDLEAIQTWLEQEGFSIDQVARSRNSITFSGSAAQIESAFHAEIHNYSVNGKRHFANATDLSIPAALSGVVGSVGNLNDFRPSPNVKFRPAEASARPTFTSGQTGNHYLTPKDVATIYDISAVYNSGYTGAGQSIAVVGQSNIYVSDIENFQSAAGLSTKDPTLVLVPSSGSAAYSSGDEAESDLDLEYTGGIAKGSSIYFVYVGDNAGYSVWDSIEYAVDTDISPIISVSYGACETALSSSEYSTLESYMEQGASQGQSIIVASGDSGSTACYGDSSLTTSQQEALAVNYPASSAYVTAVGGTEFPSDDVSSSNTAYWESSSGSDVVSSAKSYIPEQVWNDDSLSGLSSGGGGTSTMTARPSWQSGVTGIPSGSYRLVPDISLDSSPNNAGYLYCSSDSASIGISGSCSNGFRDSNSKYLTIAGGTSFAAPIFAGMMAVINQAENSSGQGLLNKTLYKLASNSSTYASAFHDITSGGNECEAGPSYCSSTGASKYDAGTGYDEATGLGSIDLYNLVTAWPSSSSSSLHGTTTSFSPSSATVITGASETFTITVASGSSSSSSTPTGSLTISVDGTKQTSSLSLSKGSATYTFSSTTTGSHVITATYSGDSTYASSSGTGTATVISSSGSGGSGTSSVTVTPSGGYTGTVDLGASSTNSYLQKYACYQISNATISSNSAVSETLTVYLGSSTCSGTSNTQSFRAASAPKGSSKAAPVKSLASLGALGLLLAAIVGRGSRRIRATFSVLGLIIGFALVTGCSGSSTSKTFTVSDSPASITISAGNSGIPTGSYTITIEGKDSSKSSLSSSTTLTLTVD